MNASVSEMAVLKNGGTSKQSTESVVKILEK